MNTTTFSAFLSSVFTKKIGDSWSYRQIYEFLLFTKVFLLNLIRESFAILAQIFNSQVTISELTCDLRIANCDLLPTKKQPVEYSEGCLSQAKIMNRSSWDCCIHVYNTS